MKDKLQEKIYRKADALPNADSVLEKARNEMASFAQNQKTAPKSLRWKVALAISCCCVLMLCAILIYPFLFKIHIEGGQNIGDNDLVWQSHDSIAHYAQEHNYDLLVFDNQPSECNAYLYKCDIAIIEEKHTYTLDGQNYEILYMIKSPELDYDLFFDKLKDYYMLKPNGERKEINSIVYYYEQTLYGNIYKTNLFFKDDATDYCLTISSESADWEMVLDHLGYID